MRPGDGPYIGMGSASAHTSTTNLLSEFFELPTAYFHHQQAPGTEELPWLVAHRTALEPLVAALTRQGPLGAGEGPIRHGLSVRQWIKVGDLTANSPATRTAHPRVGGDSDGGELVASCRLRRPDLTAPNHIGGTRRIDPTRSRCTTVAKSRRSDGKPSRHPDRARGPKGYLLVASLWRVVGCAGLI